MFAISVSSLVPVRENLEAVSERADCEKKAQNRDKRLGKGNGKGERDHVRADRSANCQGGAANVTFSCLVSDIAAP